MVHIPDAIGLEAGDGFTTAALNLTDGIAWVEVYNLEREAVGLVVGDNDSHKHLDALGERCARSALEHRGNGLVGATPYHGACRGAWCTLIGTLLDEVEVAVA